MVSSGLFSEGQLTPFPHLPSPTPPHPPGCLVGEEVLERQGTGLAVRTSVALGDAVGSSFPGRAPVMGLTWPTEWLF